LKTLVVFAKYLGKTKHLGLFLNEWTTRNIFENSSQSFRDEFLSYYDENLQINPDILYALQAEPFGSQF
jgi:hypothetical protein